jgi:anti-sigma factor RsiW
MARAAHAELNRLESTQAITAEQRSKFEETIAKRLHWHGNKLEEDDLAVTSGIRAILDAEREALVQLRAQRKLDNATLRGLLLQLDLNEASLPD